jgi:hypothetical protein
MNSLLKLYFVIIGIGQIFFVYEIYLIFNSLPIPNYIHLSNFVIGILIEIIMISILFMRLSNRILKYLLPLILIPVINIPLILTSMYFITKSKRIILILLPMLIANLIFQLITFGSVLMQSSYSIYYCKIISDFL